jgi:hypothetical protein
MIAGTIMAEATSPSKGDGYQRALSSQESVVHDYRLPVRCGKEGIELVGESALQGV